MEQPKPDALFLEIGLLLIVTGMMVGVLLLGLDLVLARESRVASSSLLALVSVLALSVVFGTVFFLVRRVKRLFEGKRDPP